MSATPESVSSITGKIKSALENEFNDVTVIGELSGLKKHNSGHWYFALKDSDAIINCTMWRSMNSLVRFNPKDGDKVVITGKVSVYAPRGSYQIDTRSMKPAGVGDLQAAFEELKQKLYREGLFDTSLKKDLPDFPLNIGVVTSSDGAAFKDICSTAARRFPIAVITIAPCKVQGAGAAEEIAAAILKLDRSGQDVIIVARGGGSIEDLWAFNEEVVARAIFKCATPVVSGVGHEIDFTIADFVADVRAATPTAAMEIVTPDITGILNYTAEWPEQYYDMLRDEVAGLRDNIQSVFYKDIKNRLTELVRNGQQRTDFALYKIQTQLKHNLNESFSSLKLLASRIEQGNIKKTLKKGFVLVRQKDKFVLDGKKLSLTEPFDLQFRDETLTIPPRNYE